MTTAVIFLSYRRQDMPGYVGRLADHLESAFGQVVFRDVDSISAGSDWKKVLNQAVSQSEIVLAIIGNQWQSILESKSGEDTDYIKFELNLAHLLDKPIVPIVLQGAKYDNSRDLGDLNWINELQFFELSDRQNRWHSDLEQLVLCITELTDLQPVKPTETEGKQVEPNIQQTSHGDQSPNIATSSGDVTIKFGNNTDDKGQS